MANYLPDTSITALAKDSKVYMYIQLMNGEVQEYYGEIKGTQDIYTQDKRQTATVLVRYQDEDTPYPDGPKFYTPLAAAFLGDTRYLFYVDDNNNLRDYKKGPARGDDWVAGSLYSDLGYKCAQYSKLTAASVTNTWGTSICLYYQSNEKDAAIKQVNFKLGQPRWQVDTTRVTDPPLYGTSLAAVRPRDGLVVDKSQPDAVKGLPVVYLQLDTLQLAHAQGSLVQPMEHYKNKFAPHTSLSAVDPNGGLQYFYTSTDNNVIRRVIFKSHTEQQYDTLGTPTPRSAIAAVCAKANKVVLFYQAYNPKPERVQLYAMTLSEIGGYWDGIPSKPGIQKLLE